MVDTLRTRTEMLDEDFQDGQPDNSMSAQDMRNLIISLRDNQHQAWVFYADGTRIALGSAQEFDADVRAKLLCDGSSALTQTGQIRRMTDIWNTSESRMQPVLNHTYDLRISFKAQTATGGTGNHFVLDMDIGAGGIGTGPVILADTRPLIKGSSIEHSFVFSWPMFALAPFPTNFGTLFLESNVDLSVWDVRIFITHTSAPDD